MFSLILSVLWSMSSNEEKSYVGTWPNANPNGGTMIEKKKITNVPGESHRFLEEACTLQKKMFCHRSSVT